MPEPVLRILLVEDSAADARLTAAYLQESDPAFSVQRAGRLGEALERLDEADLLLLDLSLPDSETAATLRAARAQSARLPIVVLTGTDDEALARDAVQSGVQDYLTKDELSPRTLARAVRYAVERHRSQRREVELRDRIQQAREEAMTTLIRGLAHDLNNMLTVIVSDLGGAQAEHGPDDHLRDALQATSMVSNLIAELVQLTTHGEASLVRLSLTEVVRETVEMLSPRLDSRIELRCTETPGRVTVLGDRTQLSRMLMNLLVNAADSVVERIESDGAGSRAPRIAVSVESRVESDGEGHLVALVVEDNGVGMSPAVARRIFDPFFTTKTDAGKTDDGRSGGGANRRSGTGLGLATVAHVVREHGGRIDVESSPGAGARFTVLLPMDDTFPGDGDDPERPQGAGSGRPRRRARREGAPDRSAALAAPRGPARNGYSLPAAT